MLQDISTPNHRQKQLTRYTALAIFQTCNGMFEIARHLISTTHSYVALRKFTMVKLEKWDLFQNSLTNIGKSEYSKDKYLTSAYTNVRFT